MAVLGYELVRDATGKAIGIRDVKTGQVFDLSLAEALVSGGPVGAPAGALASGLPLMRGGAAGVAARKGLERPVADVMPGPTFKQTLEAQRAARAAGRPTPRVYEADVVRPQQPQLPLPSTPALPAPAASMPYTPPTPGMSRSLLWPAVAGGVGTGMVGGALYNAGQTEPMSPALPQTPARAVPPAAQQATPPVAQQAAPQMPVPPPAETPAVPAPKAKAAGKSAARAKAAQAELAATKAIGESGAAVAAPAPGADQIVPMTPSGRPDYNYYAEMLNAADSNDAYYRDFINLRNQARFAAQQARARGERFQFVPLRDYKANRVYFVNADGTDVVLNMDDPQDQKEYARAIEKTGADPNLVASWADRSSRPLARYFMPPGQRDTSPDFGYLPRGPMMDASKAAPVAAAAKEAGPPMPETQGEPSPMGLSLAQGPMMPKGPALGLPKQGRAFSELELQAMGYRGPSAEQMQAAARKEAQGQGEAITSAFKDFSGFSSDLPKEMPSGTTQLESPRSRAFIESLRPYPEQPTTITPPPQGIDPNFAPVILEQQMNPDTLRTYRKPIRGSY